MIEMFVKRPVTTIMFVAFFTVLGIVSWFNIPTELMPKIDFPMVTVKVVYPGATPVEVETQIVKKIEDVVAEISDIDKIESYSYESFTFILVSFNLGANVNIKSMEVKDKVEAIINDLPKNSERPIIEKFDPFVAPVVEFVLSSDKHSPVQIHEYADKILKNRFSTIKGVAEVEIYGGRKRQINVKLDPMLMKRWYLSIEDVIGSIGTKNLNIPGGPIERTDDSLNVRFIGEFADVASIGTMPLVSRDGHKITLNDIGSIEDSFKKVTSIARFNSREVVGLSIKKASDANAVDVAQLLLKKMPDIANLLPSGMKLEKAADMTKYIVNETWTTEMNIVYGIILTTIILFLFTGNFRLTFISAIVIPTSVISTMFLVDKSAFTINFMTLLGIATCLGTLIANAIIIIENILVHLEKGEDPVTAAVNGTKEVSVAVLASTGTNLVVFTPIAFMGGIVGQFFKQFGLTVVYATLFSLFASFTLTPMMCAALLKKTKKQADGKKSVVLRYADNVVGFMLKEYKIIFDLMFKYPKTTLILNLTFLLLSLFWFGKFIGNEFIPVSDQDRISVDLVMPQGTTVQKTADVMKEIEEHVKNVPEAESWLTFAGTNGPEEGTMIINLPPSVNRTRSDLDIINSLIPDLSKIPEAEINLVRGDGEAGTKGDVSIHIYGTDYEAMIDYSRQISKIMENSGWFRSVFSSYKTPKEEIQFTPDDQAMTLYDATNIQVAQSMRASINGDDTNLYKEEGEEYRINVEIDDLYKATPDDVSLLNLITPKGLLQLSDLGKVTKKTATPTIRHRDKQRIILIEGLLSKSTAGKVQPLIAREFDKIPFKNEHGYHFTGRDEHQQETFREIIKAFIIASILTYMILAAITNSFVHPFTISTCIVTSLSGVLIFLFFMEHSINVGSMLAIVMLVGLVVNNAILVLDYASERLKEGVQLKDAIWLGCEAKFKAVLMTSIAIIFGTLPQLTDPMKIKASMGSVIMGGILASILVTFTLIPVVFWYVERMRLFVMAKIRRQRT
jgi:HAE1 family hydrophobic/amphiphilic exporter-1